MKKTLTLFVVLWSVLSANALLAQVDRTIHQTFVIDSIGVVRFDIAGEYEFVTWAGNTILTETYVKLENAMPQILKYVIEEGRYEIESFNDGASVLLNSRFPIRKKIHSKRGDCEESIHIKIFIPEEYTVVNDKQIVRKGASPMPSPPVEDDKKDENSGG